MKSFEFLHCCFHFGVIIICRVSFFFLVFVLLKLIRIEAINLSLKRAPDLFNAEVFVLFGEVTVALAVVLTTILLLLLFLLLFLCQRDHCECVEMKPVCMTYDCGGEESCGERRYHSLKTYFMRGMK